MRPRRILAYGVAVTLAATVLAAVSPSVFSFLDLRIYDAMVRAARTRPPSGHVVIVAIDDRSVSEIGQWPWPRDVIAQLVDGVRRLGASVVAADLLLSEPDRFRGTVTEPSPGDVALAATLAEGRAVMSYAFTFDGAPTADAGCVLHPLAAIVVEGSDRRSPVDQLFHASGIICSLPAFNQSAGASGYLNASADRDGLLRRVPLLMEFKGQVYPSLALAAVLRATGGSRVTLTGLPGRRARLEGASRPVPLDERGTLLIRFRGRRGTYPRIPACDVLRGRVAAGALKDRIAFVGATALGVQDVVSTPYDNAMWGIEVHASAADTILQGDFVSTPSSWRAFEIVATLGLGLMAAGLVAVAGYFYGSVLAVSVLALLWWGTFVEVSAGQAFLSPVFPTGAVIFVLLAVTAGKVRHERGRADAESRRRVQAHRFAVQSLTSLMETRDAATGRHARRTQEFSRLLAAHLACLPRFKEYLTPERVDLLARLSPLHDLGKVGVRDAVLNKPGPLTDQEIDEMRQHPGFGYQTIANAERLAGDAGGGDPNLMQLAKEIVYTHHERWDGHGYPRGLRGEEIPIAGRIIALVDVYDALTNSRTYRSSLSHEQAVTTLSAGRGTHFDPDVVDAFIAVQEQFRQLATAFATEATEETSAR